MWQRLLYRSPSRLNPVHRAPRHLNIKATPHMFNPNCMLCMRTSNASCPIHSLDCLHCMYNANNMLTCALNSKYRVCVQEALGGSPTPAPSQTDLLDSSGASEEMKSDRQTSSKQSLPVQGTRKELEPKSKGSDQAKRKDSEPKSKLPHGRSLHGGAGLDAKTQTAVSEGKP